MKYFSMFSGIGGFELGIEKAYWFSIAKELSKTSNNPKQIGVVVVKDGEIIAQATNSHEEPCKRAGYPTGVGYELCEGCQYTNHAEAKAVKGDVAGADLYMYGHYYACEPCQTSMDKAGIRNVYIRDSEHAFVSEESEQEERTQGWERPTDLGGTLLHTGDRTAQLCIGYSEIDKYAIKVYERNFNGHRNYGSATDIVAGDLPDFDLLVGGFPCQAFSIAGKRKGFDDTRGTLFFDIARILKDKRPGHLVLENVKGLLSHDGGETFKTILKVLADLGYRVEWQVLNSKDFGVPQNRERIYIVGHLGDGCRGKVFPIIGSSQQIASVAGYISEEVWPRRHEQIRRTYNTDGAMPTIPTGQGGGVMTKIYQEPRIRRLTPKECERLQGFPDDWTALDAEGNRVSDTQRYKMCGNAVTTNVVQAVMERIFDHE